MSFDPHTDEMLSRLAQKHKGLDDFLDSIFGFFERRTDLFHVMQTREDRMGFPPTIAKKMVDTAFEKHLDLYQKRTGNKVPEGIEKAIRRPLAIPTSSSSSSSAAPAASVAAGTETKGGSSSSTNSAAVEAASSASVQPPVPAATSSAGGNGKGDAKRAAAEQKKLDPNSNMCHISTWNGAVTDRYRWSQSLDEVTIEFVLEREVKSKEVKVAILQEKVRIELDGKSVLDEKLFERVEPSQCIWNLEDKKKVVLSLDKIRKTWWKSVFLDGHEIDTTKVESVKRIDDYDGETQGAIRKIVFDQNQKHLGKPTSDQIKTAEVMKDAWNAEGSPFKGTEFDPSVLNLTNQLPEKMWKS